MQSQETRKNSSAQIFSWGQSKKSIPYIVFFLTEHGPSSSFNKAY